MVGILCIAMVLPGHLALCLFASNYLNAVIVNRSLRHLVTVPLDSFLALAPVLLAACAALGYWDLSEPAAWNTWQSIAGGYLLLAFAVTITFVPRWLFQRLTARPPALLLSNHTTVTDLRPILKGRPISGRMGRVYLNIPGNESLQLAYHEKTIEVARLPMALDGLTITHLSDLHFTGRLGKAYFEEVIRRANELESDLVAVTGDLVDTPRCIDWIPDTLGRLRAAHGVYFVLGNHDLRAGATRVRQTLVECGLTDLSSRWLQQSIRGHSIVLAGNELPWFKPAAEMSDCPTAHGEQRSFRILLSHSPDQFPWAQDHDFDLMLAGHTHGGQIRFPVIGPILAPSRYGVHYASGTFHLPPLVMHVSRGISGLQPLRFNCPPELTKLVLRSP